MFNRKKSDLHIIYFNNIFNINNIPLGYNNIYCPYNFAAIFQIMMQKLSDNCYHYLPAQHVFLFSLAK